MLLLTWTQQQWTNPAPPSAGAWAIATLGFYPGSIANILWFGFGAT